MTALILFTRELAAQLRLRAGELNEKESTPSMMMALIADSIDAAAKKAFHL